MTEFVDASGNLLAADVDALVNTVNTVGVMGKGIALQFKNAYPANFKAYARACKAEGVQLGDMFVFDTGALTGPRWIINFPTKGHWRSNSRLSDVEDGLDSLRATIEELRIKTIAIPPLGCGNGGLDWSEVRPLIEKKLDGLDVQVHIYGPAGAPAAADMVVATERKPLSPGKAALVALVARYSAMALGASLIEIQKLMYFLQEAGENLRLNYSAELYGPYADNLRHVLVALEGHHLSGFGDGSSSVQQAESLVLLPGAIEEAEATLLSSADIAERMDRVLDLVAGYESAYGVELLATVHWVASHLDDGSDDVSVVEGVQGWSQRKQRMFTDEHIAAALGRLRNLEWLGPVPVAV
jgi:O-acetyl-ADP-ribose deacetylase (regulator of RNase III)